MSSSRLPGKVLKNIVGKPMLGHIVERLSWVPAINKIVVATSGETTDQPIYEFCRQNSINCYRGSLNDVLDRFYQAALEYGADAYSLQEIVPVLIRNWLPSLLTYFSGKL